MCVMNKVTACCDGTNVQDMCGNMVNAGSVYKAATMAAEACFMLDYALAEQQFATKQPHIQANKEAHIPSPLIISNHCIILHHM